eukprot:9955696-Alexandrium_andersonii.AAC.1
MARSAPPLKSSRLGRPSANDSHLIEHRAVAHVCRPMSRSRLLAAVSGSSERIRACSSASRQLRRFARNCPNLPGKGPQICPKPFEAAAK